MLKIKEYKGITLIALVISIIVLLILAGVTINAISGSESAPAKANEAGQKNDIGAAKDDISITVVNAKMQGMENAYVENGVSASNAQNVVGRTVIQAVADKYATNNQIGKATITVDVEKTNNVITDDAIVSISTTDFEVEGTITLNDGILTWGEIEPITPGLTLKTTSLILAPAKQGTIKYKVRGVNGNISWISDNQKISVENGIVTVDSTAVENDTATITVSIGEYTKTCSVTVQDIWEDATISRLNNMIGTEILNDSYVANDKDNNDVKDWQIFYADSGTDEVFIISKNILETNTAIDGQNGSYSGSASFRTPYVTGQDLSYGIKWNAKWLAECSENESSNNNALTAAYLCDSKQWERYKTGPANYAVGGPTIEMFIASLKENIGNDYSNYITSSKTGYYFNITNKAIPESYSENSPYRAKYNSKKFGSWLLSSPHGARNNYLYCVYDSGQIYYDQYGYGAISYNTVGERFGVRPLVSIPLTSVKVKGSQVKIVP